MSLLSGVAFAVLGAVLYFVLRESKSPLAPLLPLLGGVALLLSAFSSLGKNDFLSALAGYGIEGDMAKTVFKVLFAGFIIELGADVCEELGSAALGKRLCFFGNIEILLLVLPILSEIFSLSGELLS